MRQVAAGSEPAVGWTGDCMVRVEVYPTKLTSCTSSPRKEARGSTKERNTVCFYSAGWVGGRGGGRRGVSPTSHYHRWSHTVSAGTCRPGASTLTG